MSDRFQGFLIGISCSLVVYLGCTILSGIVFNSLDERREINEFEYRTLIEEIKNDTHSKQLLKLFYENDGKIDKSEAKMIISDYYMYTVFPEHYVRKMYFLSPP